VQGKRRQLRLAVKRFDLFIDQINADIEQDFTMSAKPPEQSMRLRRRTRLIVLLVSGMVIVGLGATYRYFRYARPVGEGPAGPTVQREAFESTWSDRKAVLLGLGDSVTQGLGASPGKTYFLRLFKNPIDEFSDMQGISLSKVLPGLEPINLAISGMTSIECVDHQLPKLRVYDSETFGIVVITAGGNDVIHNYGRTPPREGAMYGARADEITEWVHNFDQRLDVIADKVRQAFPGGCEIFIANIYDPTDGDGDTVNAGLPPWSDGVEVLQAYNEVLTEFADRHDDVTLVDMRTAFLGHGIHCTHFWHHAYRKSDPCYWYWDNLEDPNDRGYDAIRRLFLIEMARVLPGKLKP
jgi:lysophospholipase L1-like esterase